MKKKQRLYIDGFAEEIAPYDHAVRELYPENDSATIKGWETDFRDILAWIESLEPPKYPFEIDQARRQGRTDISSRLRECHGTYGADGEYPEKCVPIDDVNTDLSA